nr:plasmid recombination protein [Clostridia bacterium]
MPRNDGKNYTVARNRDLCGNDIRNAQGHNERQNETYSNEDIVPEHTSFNVRFKQPTADYSEMFDQMEQAGTISTRGLKADATHFCEMVLDVNSAYFFNHGGYEFAKQFYADAYKAAAEIIGGEQYILSAVMHADERNRAMSDALGQDVYHYHMHIVYVPVVEKQILWSKRCKDPALRGTVKETIMQVSRSKKWASQPSLDANGQPLLSKNGKPILRPSYSVLQDRFYDHMRAAGYDDIERGQRGSTEEHLTVTQFKVQQEQQRLTKIQDAQIAASAEIAQLDADKAQAEKDVRKAEARLERLAPQVEKLEELVRRYPDDPDKVLPEAGAFESARSYREKKAMPLVKKLLKWVHSLFRKNLELTNRCEMLERSKEHDIGIWKRRFERAEEILQQLRPKAEQYDHISRVLDQEQLTQLLSQRPPTHEPTTHRQKGAVR